MASYKPVTAVMRALSVLEAMNKTAGQSTIGTLHQATGIDKATLVRMVETLCSAGYVARDDVARGYFLTGRTLSLSSGYDQHRVLGRIVEPILVGFRDAIGWPSDVALFDHDAMLVAETSREPGPLSFNRQAGYRAPMLGTSLGLAYLSYSDVETRDEIIDRVRDQVGPWNRIAADRAVLHQKLDQLRDQGFTRMDSDYSRLEYAHRISSVGVAIVGRARVHGSINTIFLKKIVSEDALILELAQKLQAVAAEIAAALDRDLDQA